MCACVKVCGRVFAIVSPLSKIEQHIIHAICRSVNTLCKCILMKMHVNIYVVFCQACLFNCDVNIVMSIFLCNILDK